LTRWRVLADRIRILQDYGQRRKYEHVVKGFNRRLDTLQAAVLRVKLRHLDEWNTRRRDHADRYRRLLEGIGVEPPRPSRHVEPVWHLYVVRVEDRDETRSSLDEHGVEAGVHYPIPIHLQPAYADLPYVRGDFPVTERAAAEILSLPMYPELQPRQIAHVADTLAALPGRAVEQAIARDAAVAAPWDTLAARAAR
jgi:dTDP-4-amino-4,6-dideoxygalactose transaminase